MNDLCSRTIIHYLDIITQDARLDTVEPAWAVYAI